VENQMENQDWCNPDSCLESTPGRPARSVGRGFSIFV